MKTQRIDKLLPVAWNGVRLALLLVAGLCLSACKQGLETVDTKDPTGNYTLVSVDGKQVPTVVTHDGAQLQIRSGAFTISEDGTCTSKMVFVPPSGTEVVREVTATYVREGSKLNMQWKGAGKTVGTFDGQRFTMNNEGMILVYQR
jgi:hypothetical protein